MTRVSAAIATWNDRDNLLECLRSLYATYPAADLEVIVVDDCSDDGSPEAVAAEFPQARCKRNAENVGYPRTANNGIRESTGEYVLMLNSDVVVLDGCLDKLVTYMDAHPRTGVAGPHVLNPDHTHQDTCWRFITVGRLLMQALGLHIVFPRFASKYPLIEAARNVDWITGCFWIMRREALDKVGLFEEAFYFYGDDIDWCKRCNDAGWDVCYVSEAEAIHVGGAATSRKEPARYFIRQLTTRLQYFRKHHGLLGRIGCRMAIYILQVRRLLAGLALLVVRPSQRAETRAGLRDDATILWHFMHFRATSRTHR